MFKISMCLHDAYAQVYHLVSYSVLRQKMINLLAKMTIKVTKGQVCHSSIYYTSGGLLCDFMRKGTIQFTTHANKVFCIDTA